MIDPTDTMGEAARKAMEPNFARMIAHEAGTRAGENCEELHDMRVALRRMRTFLQVVGDHLARAPLRPLRRGLREASAVLGAVRDLDVFRQKTEAHLAGHPEAQAYFAPLIQAWNVAYAQQRNEMLAYLDGEDYARFRARLEQQVARPLPEASPPARVAEVVPALIEARLAIVMQQSIPVGQPDAALIDYHRLRIELKRLRYTLEFFRDTLGPAASEGIAALKTLQDDLGDLQDAVVAVTHLRAALIYGTWVPPVQPETLWPGERPELANGLHAYLESREAEIDRWMEQVPRSWQRFLDEKMPARIRDAAHHLAALTV